MLYSKSEQGNGGLDAQEIAQTVIGGSYNFGNITVGAQETQYDNVNGSYTYAANTEAEALSYGATMAVNDQLSVGVQYAEFSASNLTSGTVPSARLSLGASDIPALATSKITSGTFADARFAASNITQHVDLSNLSASNLTSGTMPDARFPATLPAVSGANLTSMSVASSTGSWTPSMQVGSTGGVSAVYVKVGKMVHARCSFYLSGAQSSRSGTLLRIAGLPFTSASGNTYAGGGMILGYSGTEKAQVFVEQNNTTCVFAKDYKSPYHNIDLAYGALARRHSLIDGVESGGNYNFYYTMFCTYVTAS